jgi:hypothetical protein
VNASVKRDEYGFIVAKIPTGQIPVGPDSFAFPINVQQVFFADNDSHRNWKVVCRVDVRSRRSALQFAIDDSDVLHIGRDADFVGLSREFGNNNVFHGVIPDPEVVYIPEMRQWELWKNSRLNYIHSKKKEGGSISHEDMIAGSVYCNYAICAWYPTTKARSAVGVMECTMYLTVGHMLGTLYILNKIEVVAS